MSSSFVYDLILIERLADKYIHTPIWTERMQRPNPAYCRVESFSHALLRKTLPSMQRLSVAMQLIQLYPA